MATAAHAQSPKFGALRPRRSCDSSHELRQVKRVARIHSTGALGPKCASSAKRPTTAAMRIGPRIKRQASIVEVAQSYQKLQSKHELTAHHFKPSTRRSGGRGRRSRAGLRTDRPGEIRASISV